jgi:hypothetical protein
LRSKEEVSFRQPWNYKKWKNVWTAEAHGMRIWCF